MENRLACWKCGHSIEELPQPLGRYDICPACRAELYVCRMCEFFDPKVSKGCIEPIAEEVKEKERANFCNFFQVRPNAFEPRDDSAAAAAEAQLKALFGAGEAHAAPTGTDAGAARSEADQAREQLERLFKTPDKDED